MNQGTLPPWSPYEAQRHGCMDTFPRNDSGLEITRRRTEPAATGSCVKEASTHKSAMTHDGNVFCRCLKLHARKKPAIGSNIVRGENPAQLTYAASVDIAFRMKTDTGLFCAS